MDRSKSNDLINWSALSTHLTGHPTYIRKGKVLKAEKAKVKELLDFIEYWKTKYPGKSK